MIAVGRRVALALLVSGTVLVSGVRAAEEPDRIPARIEEVDAASRQILADGVTYALSSTVQVQRPGLSGRFGIGDLDPGMSVLLEVALPGAELPVVKSILILAE
jgi:hypothetical protein